MTVQAFWRGIKVQDAQQPYDTIHLKVLYPALNTDIQKPYAVDFTEQAISFPIVIFFSGFNCNLGMYEWLASRLVARGMVVILFNWLAKNLPGKIALTPGVDLAAFSADVYGNMPTASALPLLLAEIENLQSESVLAGRLDLGKIILGGHSAGGRIALENANPQFFSQVAGAFSYGAHFDCLF
jgi:predicted dienelactone hydrolase